MSSSAQGLAIAMSFTLPCSHGNRRVDGLAMQLLRKGNARASRVATMHGMQDTDISTAHPTPPRPLSGLLVVALEQAVAAPLCTSRLADAGARVIKIERAEGDFARGYDRAVHGESSYWVWINRGKQSIALDLKNTDDLALLQRIVAQADVFVQNLAPQATERLGLGSASLRKRHPKLITCDITGYGVEGELKNLKAYDMLVQAESGLVSINGAAGEWGRVGVSVCDITAGMNAHIGILQALLQRALTGKGSGVEVSLFGSAADLMTVPYLQARYGHKAPQRVGLNHPSIAPYGAFHCADGSAIVISIQNEREWASFCEHFLHMPDLPSDPRCANNAARVANRLHVDGLVAAVVGTLTTDDAMTRLNAGQTAYGRVNGLQELITHPQLRTRGMDVHGQTVQIPASPWTTEWEAASFASAPDLDADGASIRAEFSLG
jgi:itaconate CoA-transferase